MRGLEKSLWLHPKRRPVEVDLERFRGYPYFFESFEQYGVRLPESVTVVWRSLRQYNLEFFDDLSQEHIRWVMRVMKRGGDVPPLLVFDRTIRRIRSDPGIFDGRHRSWAAWRLGIRRAPVVDISRYWLKMGTL